MTHFELLRDADAELLNGGIDDIEIKLIKKAYGKNVAKVKQDQRIGRASRFDAVQAVDIFQINNQD
ncbi:MAG: hypothetical protein VKN13_02820 [Cyanobacteriota bacterium]|nr:hypothetical protein [Cyanobacteriota bacterium]